MSMEKISIDLSGKRGLAPFGGSGVRTRYDVQGGFVLSGIYNPYLYEGHMTPSTSEPTEVTTDNTQLSTFNSRVYDAINDDFYLAEDTAVYKGDTLSDTSLTRVLNLSSAGTIQDLEIYTINDTRKIFVVYNTSANLIAVSYTDLPISFQSATFTADTVSDNVTPSSGTWSNGLSVQLTTTGTLPAGLSLATTYYVVNAGGGVFQLSSTRGGSSINITSTGSGTHTITEVMTPLLSTASGTSIASNGSNGDAWLLPSENGYAYLFMENQVHRIDGTASGGANGTIEPNVLLFPANFRIVDAVESDGFIFIGYHKYTTDTRNNSPSFTPSGDVEAGVLIWNRRSSVEVGTDGKKLNGVAVIRKVYTSIGNSIRILATLTTGNDVIMEYSGNGFEPIFELEAGSYPVYRDSMGYFGLMDIWTAKDGRLLGHGKATIGGTVGLFPLHSISTDSMNAGVVMVARNLSAAGPAVYFTGVNASAILKNYRVPIYNLSGQLSPIAHKATTITYPMVYLPEMSTIASVMIYMRTGGNGGTTAAGTVAIYRNGLSSPIMTKTVTYDDVKKGYLHIEVNTAYCNSVQLEVAYAGTEDYGDSNFNPSFAVVSVDPTSTIG